MFAWGVQSIYITVTQGIGTWGQNSTVAWGWEIINFVWWIGIGHAGTAFSIFLLILRQKWRTAINRAAEAMTVVAVFCAALFPLIHMGRPWLFFWIFPYPNTRGPLWVNFNSPLFWDFVAISAYLLISASFWYFGMVPDFATIRDTTKSKIKKQFTDSLLSDGPVRRASGCVTKVWPLYWVELPPFWSFRYTLLYQPTLLFRLNQAGILRCFRRIS